MANYVILLAGGVGTRMGAEVPKQFLCVDKKPIIVYSIENFQKNKNVDGILVVCIKEWISHLKDLIQRYNLDKVKWVVEGGSCGHDSIKNGVLFLEGIINADDIVVVHDAVRPLLTNDLIDDVIAVAKEKGNASSSIVCHAPLVLSEDHVSSITDIDREKVMLTQAPQAFKYDLLLRCYKHALADGKNDFTYASSLLIHYGERVYFSKGSTWNIKVTKKEDLALFKALLEATGDLNDI